MKTLHVPSQQEIIITHVVIFTEHLYYLGIKEGNKYFIAWNTKMQLHIKCADIINCIAYSGNTPTCECHLPYILLNIICSEVITM